MSEPLRQRLTRLEGRAGAPSTRCPRCQADWPGSVVLEVMPDCSLKATCLRCGGPREHDPNPRKPVKVYAGIDISKENQCEP
ncbi:MAG TPA: hypothetical protein VFC78_11335 [Tepidisphaeraceae bacterium]|nr:hypothetical protein [Tepidisphaeraceae bacterium]